MQLVKQLTLQPPTNSTDHRNFKRKHTVYDWISETFSKVQLIYAVVADVLNNSDISKIKANDWKLACEVC